MGLSIDPRHEIRPLTTTQRAFLVADLNPQRIQQRDAPGGGNKKMSYLAVWDVKATLIKVFGFGGYSLIPTESKIIKVENDIPKTRWDNQARRKVVIPGEFQFRVTAQVTTEVYIHQLGAIFGGVAIASQTGADPGDVGDFAIKTADSDATKRALINLGTQFGLSLYNAGSPVDVVQKVLAPDQNNRAMRIRTVEEALQAERIEALEQGREQGVVIDAEDIRAALTVNVLGDDDIIFGSDGDEPEAPQARRTPAATVQRAGQEAPTQVPPTAENISKVKDAFQQ